MLAALLFVAGVGGPGGQGGDDVTVRDLADLPFTRSTARCTGAAGCMDSTGYCSDGSG
jgi:hypothetical protein